MTKTDNAFDLWRTDYINSEKNGTNLMWPSETLIRLFKGKYIPDMATNFKGKKILDVGFGGGNNLYFFGTLGMDLSGTEVHADICSPVTSMLNRFGLRADLKTGTNRSLPFDNHEFDYLVSWNVLHYEPEEKLIQEALKEYHRVLKPGGRIFISTTGPEHLILKGSKKLGPHQYQIGREDDFRKGQTFFYFDTPDDIKQFFSPFFKDILIGRTHDFLMTETLDWFIMTGLKK